MLLEDDGVDGRVVCGGENTEADEGEARALGDELDAGGGRAYAEDNVEQESATDAALQGEALRRQTFSPPLPLPFPPPVFFLILF